MKLISVKNILYDLSLTVDPSNWNEVAALEWAVKASRKIGAMKMYTKKEIFLEVKDFVSGMPEDLVELNSIFVFNNSLNNLDSVNNSLLNHQNSNLINTTIWLERMKEVWSNHKDKWNKVFLEIGNYMSPCMRNSRKQCFPMYRENGNIWQFNFEEGIICVSYLSYAVDKGEYMIPDNEDFKDAIIAYILYRLSDANTFKEYSKENVEQRNYYLQRYGILAAKAKGKMTEPNQDQLTAIGNYRNSLLPTNNASLFDYSQTFLPEQPI